MRFHWVRHGPTHAKGMVGWSDLPADLGDTAQVTRLSAHLPAGALVISSDLVRSVATADAICGDRQRLPHDRDLREMSFGDWELKTSAEITETHPELSRAFWTDPGETRPPAGESWTELTARTSAAVARLMQAHPGRDIVAVAHIGVILAQVAVATGQPAREVIGQKIDNLSVTELSWDGTGWRLGRINHLP
ncbi:MAG: histidine phosphatase family protein [Pseudooceanicola nanhaiensis]|uniref:histidine phosphatase family protein n=1 Tax=Pseudooceanicola nanhaiensis TaxID=375761 RepID=UPI0040587E83